MRLLLVVLFPFLWGCAINSATSNVSPGVDLRDYQSIHVVKSPHDRRGTYKIIAGGLTAFGLRVSSGDIESIPDDAQAVFRYQEKWRGTIKQSLRELNIQLTEVGTDFPLATANSLQITSKRMSQAEMVEELLSSIFGGKGDRLPIGVSYKMDSGMIKAGYFDAPISQLPIDQLPISVNVIGQGVWSVPDEMFNTALVKAVNDSDLFRDVADSDSSEYTLYVSLLSMDRVDGGMNVEVTAQWLLFRTSDRSILFQSEVISDYYGSDNFGRGAEFNIAAGQAIYYNINRGLHLISVEAFRNADTFLPAG